MNVNEYIRSVQKMGAYIPETLRLDRYGEIDIDGVTQPITLLEDFLDSGAFTVIIENNKVQRNAISSTLVAALRSHKHPFSNHWRNLSRGKVNCIAYINIEHQRQYLKQVNLFSTGSFLEPGNEVVLFNTNFFNEPAEDSLVLFKGAMHKYSPSVVIFDAETIFESGSKNVQIMKQVLRLCCKNDIAPILFLRHEKILRYLPSPDRLVRIWNNSNTCHSFIVETIQNIGEDSINSFKIKFENSELKSEDIEDSILDKIIERNKQYDEPGIGPGATEAIINMHIQDF